MRGALAALAALALVSAGCGGGSPLPVQGSAFQPPAGASDAGTRRPNWSPVKGVPSFKVAVHAGDEVSFGMRLRNVGAKAVTVGGVGADADVDGYLRPKAMSPATLRLAPGETDDVRITAGVACGDSAPGQLRYKQAQLFRLGGRERQVRFGAMLLVTCS